MPYMVKPLSGIVVCLHDMLVYILSFDSHQCCDLLPQAWHQSRLDGVCLLVQLFQGKNVGG